jgi:hypothetical protein
MVWIGGYFFLCFFFFFSPPLLLPFALLDLRTEDCIGPNFGGSLDLKHGLLDQRRMNNDLT